MNQTERLMLSEIHLLTNAVPNFKNNMDMQGYSAFRSDSLQMQRYLHELTYALLMQGSPEEEKTEWKKQFEQVLNEAKEFVRIRKVEQWHAQTSFRYDIGISGW